MRKHYLLLSIVAFFFMTASSLRGQVVISEIISSNMVELHNQSVDTIDVDQYWFCNRPEYNRIGSLNTSCGNFNMPPNSYLVVTTNFNLSLEGDELGVYSSGDFGDDQSIIDYVIWGNRSGQTRESVAVSAGIWTDGDRALAIDSSSALIYDGEGNVSTDYFLGESNQCEANITTSCTSTSSSIRASNDTTVVSICVGDDAIELVTAEVIGTSSGPNSAWVVTDTALNILSIDTVGIFDLESSSAGVCLIWHIDFEDGLMGATVGSNVSDLDGCFALSNSIEVNKLTGDNCEGETLLCDADGGTIVDQDGMTAATFCTQDDFVQLVIASVSGQRGTNSSWVVTDTALNIISIDTINNINLEQEGPGIYEIWHLSFEDDLTGASVGNNVSDLGGCFDLSNSITLTIIATCNDSGGSDTCQVIGGTIVDQDGLTEVTICADDADEDLIVVTQSGASGANSAYVVTDTSLNILSIEMNTNVFNLESASARVCLIWHLSFEDDLTGAMVGANAADLGGCFSLSNAITVTKETSCGSVGGEPTGCDVSGGMITDQDGMTERTLCTSDANEDLIIVGVSGASGTNSGFVVTDSSLNILIVETNTSVFSLESISSNVCLVWHISYEDDLTGATVGANAMDLDGCFALSNAITVTKTSDCGDVVGEPLTCDVSGGSIVDQDGLAASTICVDDEGEDLIIVSLSGASGANSAYVVTDTSLNILFIESNTNVFNLEPLGVGVCLIWHISYEDDLTGASIGSSATNLGGCFALSNAITVTRLAGDNCNTSVCEVNAGTLSLTDGSTSLDICVGDGVSDAFDVVIDSAVGSDQAWVITDTAGVIIALPLEPPFDLEGTEVGTCLLWHIVSEGDLTGVALGANANAIAGCFALSNPLTIIRSSGDDCPLTCDVTGGTISTGDNATDISVCIDDAESEDIVVALSDQSGTNSAWVVTDTLLTILEIDTNNVFNFDSAGAGVCLIWHLSFEDGLIGAVVDSNAANLSGCFSLSNSISVTRLVGDDCPMDSCTAQGGSLTTADGSTEITLCNNDADPFDVNLIDAQGDRNAWVITDTTGMILGFPLAPPFDLSNADVGTYLVWHLAFNGTITGASLGSNASDLQGCFGLSNPITVTRTDVMASEILYADSTQTQTICVGDGVTDEISVVSSGGSSVIQSWVVTDTVGVILDLPDGFPVDFELTQGGTCLIWLLNHGSDISGATIGANANDLQGCFALSNPLTLIREGVDGGSLLTDIGSQDLLICVGDDIADEIDLTLSGAQGQNSAFVVTDSAGVILETSDVLDFDFDNAGPGVCLIWHVSYNDGTSGLAIGDTASNISGCFDLSNPVTLTRVSGDDCPPPCGAVGGRLETVDGETSITLCTDDNLSDLFDLTVVGAVGDTVAFVVTDDLGNILGINQNFEADFEGTGAGELFVRSISYNSGTLLPDVGGNINLLTGCFALSNIFTVNRVEGPDCNAVCAAEGGVLSSDLGTEITVCSDDGIEDVVSFLVSGFGGANNTFVITDAAAEIIRLTTETTIDFEGTGSGTSLIWHISYEDGLSGLIEGANANDLEGCFDLTAPITVIRQIEGDCPQDCTTDGGTISTIEGETDLVFCAGDVSFSVTHDNMSDDSTTSYFYVVTDENGIIEDWQNSLDGGNFNLNRDPGGICRIYGYSSLDGEEIEEGLNIDDLGANCSAVSTNFINVTKETGGACDEGCHVPRDVRLQNLNGNRWVVSWDRVDEARGYTVLVGYEGLPNSFAEVPIRRSRITLTGPEDRVIVIQIKANCGFGEESPYTELITLIDSDGSRINSSIGRNLALQHGTVLPSGIIINEQAVAYPNPAQNHITVWYDGQDVDGKLSIFDQTGRRVVTRTISGSEEFHNVSIEALSDGMYFMMIESEGQILMQDKLIKAN